MRIERLAEEFGLEVSWTHFPLHPETPVEGRSLEDLFAGRGYDLEGMKAQLKQFADAEGLPYGDRSMTYNSRLAQELAAWAETQDAGAGIHDALFRAYFVDGKNIGDPEVLIELARGLGLDEDTARGVLASRSYGGVVDQHWQRSRDVGVTGVPTFVFAGRGVVGAQPYEVLEQLVEAAGIEPVVGDGSVTDHSPPGS